MNLFSNLKMFPLNIIFLNGKMKHLRISYFFLTILFLLTFLNCSSYLYTVNDSNENTTNFSSCGKSIEFISERYSDLDTTFPIQKKSAREYVLNKLPEIEAYFNKNIDVLKNDTTNVSIEYQSDSKVIISNLFQLKDTTVVMKDINDNIFASYSLDSNLIYSLSVELSLIRNNNIVHVNIDDVNYSTVIGRSKANIMRTIMNSLSKMRYEYNRILRKYRGVKGRLTMKFIIDESGNIIYLKVIESSLDNCEMENNEVNIVKKCYFGESDKKPNLTTVIYPFVFSQ